MLRMATIYRRFAASTRGVAAIEFAMILPVLVLILLASFDGGRAIAIYLKLRASTYSLASIANQYSTIHDADKTSILNAAGVVMAPYDSTPIVAKLSQITVNASGTATINWSDALNGTANTVGSSVTIPSGVAPANSCTCLILSEVSYAFTPMFGYFPGGTITMSDNLYVTPRSVPCIQRTSP